MEPFQTKYLFPGEIFYSIQPYKITTILGSCVSVTIFNKKNNFGGINHFLLSESNNAETQDANKYGNFAMKNLISGLLKIDPDVSNYEAKMFGGGKVISSIIDFKIGENNINAARNILNQYGIPVITECVDNDFGLKIIFFNFNNKVFVTRI